MKKIASLQPLAKMVLFVTSYLPLFILIIFRQVYENWAYLNWAGFSRESVWTVFTRFGLSGVLLFVSLFGSLGAIWTLTNLQKAAKNGRPAKLVDVKNRNNESIGYIATYIIPFLFQNLSSPFEFFSVIFLLIVIYSIYVNSTMLIINPVLGRWYSIYEIAYEQNGTIKNGMIISRSPEILEGESIKLYQIGFKLYFGAEFVTQKEDRDV